jgi:hypothetical protein
MLFRYVLPGMLLIKAIKNKTDMEFLKLNIDSTKPFYTDKLGNIYNQNYKILKGSKINGSLFLSFVLKGDKKISCKESVSRLIYQTHFPDEDLSDYNIFKKDLTIENPYQIDNLKKVLKTDMPIQNKLPEKHSDKKNPIKRKFYEKLSAQEFNILIALAKNPNVKGTTLIKLYSVSGGAIYNHRKFLSTQKPKKL